MLRPTGLEYSVPARGGWTIVHVGMLLPEAHEIFVCAAGCLRGVVLSAAEMGLMGRFSTVAIEEHNVVDGDMENLLLEGVTDILRRLPKLPPAVLVYSSCIHHFTGCDLPECYKVLSRRFPGVQFVDCYMTPTMRKSGLTPDQLMRRQLYSLLPTVAKNSRSCAIVGNCFSLAEGSDLLRLLHQAGYKVWQLPDLRRYREYLCMAESSFYIVTQPVAQVAGTVLARRLGAEYLYLPVSYNFAEIEAQTAYLAGRTGVDFPLSELRQEAEAALLKTRQIVGSVPVAVDYTLTSRPFGLARLLAERGFNVTRVYADVPNLHTGGANAGQKNVFKAEPDILRSPDFGFSNLNQEEQDREWLFANVQGFSLLPTVHPDMRFRERGPEKKILALGQKAAFFENTAFFVDLVENGGLWGFDGIRKMAELMAEAWQVPKMTEKIISRKGWGCVSCL